MKKQHLLFATFILAGSLTVSGQTPDTADSLSAQRTLTIDEVVVTGTRHQTDIRHLSQTVSVVNRKRIEQSMQPSLLPVLTEQVPGLFTTSRGVMGYGVSNGAAGGISLRGLSGGNARLMVLIDGHPQYAGIFGHPIADAYQTLLADRVEVLRGPASVLYGSNAMGGVVNIVTRKMHEEGIRTHLHRVRFLQHVGNRTDEPHPQRAFFERHQRLVQPHGRASCRHGIRAVRRLRPDRLRGDGPLESACRRERDPLQRLLSRPGIGSAAGR